MCDIQVCVQNCNWRMWKMANAEFETYYSTREHFVGCRWTLSLGRWYATSQKNGKRLSIDLFNKNALWVEDLYYN